ncbi:hypothetical protein Tco_0682597 [Tanacetum coccineum]|uniref:Uncharacterized protein n=1 Tax=Tanacetum coccineum TaxID=301880 RepID=A0ABQ4XSP1_9ASTR
MLTLWHTDDEGYGGAEQRERRWEHSESECSVFITGRSLNVIGSGSCMSLGLQITAVIQRRVRAIEGIVITRSERAFSAQEMGSHFVIVTVLNGHTHTAWAAGICMGGDTTGMFCPTAMREGGTGPLAEVHQQDTQVTEDSITELEGRWYLGAHTGWMMERVYSAMRRASTWGYTRATDEHNLAKIMSVEEAWLTRHISHRSVLVDYRGAEDVSGYRIFHGT